MSGAQPGGRGHLIVCGLNNLGLQLVTELRALGEDVTVVAEVPTGAQRAHVAGLRLVEGAPHDDANLVAAGVHEARAIAFVAASDDTNLRAAVRAQTLNPRIRIVMRLFNEGLGRSIDALFTDCTILSAAAIAAPFFVAQALGETGGHRFAGGGRLLMLGERGDAPAGAATLAVLGRRGPDGCEILPGGEPRGGDVTVYDLGVTEAGTTPEPRERLPRRTRAVMALGTVRAVVDHRFRVLLSVLGAIMLVSIAVFVAFKGLSPLDSVYFTVTTLATVGYGDIGFLNDAVPIKVYGIALIVVGAAVVAIFYALLTDAIVGVRLARALGSVRGHLRGHVIVCGAGNLGFAVAESLVRRGVPCAVIERDGDSPHLPALRRMGVPVVLADAALSATLEHAQVAHARALVACTNDDIIDLAAAVNARAQRPDLRVVLRMFDRQLAERVEQTYGIAASSSLATITAPIFAAELLQHSVLAAASVDGTPLVVGEVEVLAGAALEGATVSQAAGPQLRVLAVIPDAGAPQWSPAPELPLRATDRLLVAATRDAYTELAARSA